VDEDAPYVMPIGADPYEALLEDDTRRAEVGGCVKVVQNGCTERLYRTVIQNGCTERLYFDPVK
jgi:hypothetical protein